MVTGMQRFAPFLVVAFMCAVLPGCGGGGDGSNPSSAPPPPESKVPEVNAPLPSAAFGGGQGKILFVEGINVPRSIAEFDLATRRVRTLANLEPKLTLAVIQGGVTRANDGTFAIIRNELDFVHSPIISHYQADGTLLHSWEVPHDVIFGLVSMPRPAESYTEGGALSPDAKAIALAGGSADRSKLEIVILDVQSGTFVIEPLLGADVSPPDKTFVNAGAVWSPAGELYVLSEEGLHRVDRVTGAGTLMHPVKLANPRAPMMSPDGRTIYFDQDFGNPHNSGTIWSMDVASGVLTRRSMRSGMGSQYSPTLSPDGEWLLLQEADFAGGVFIPNAIFSPNPLIGTVSIPSNVSAVRLSEQPRDTQNSKPAIEDASGRVHSARGRMVWY